MVHVYIAEEVLKFSKEIDKKLINDLIQIIIKEETKENSNLNNKEIFVSILFASEEKIRKLNKEYRKIDKETDVLSFPLFTQDELCISKLKHLELGDIVICPKIVKKQAISYGTKDKRELLYMITHGMYHLLGYNHETNKEKEIMRKKEENVLSLLLV